MSGLHPDLFASDHLVIARRRVLLQLVESLVFEGVVRFEISQSSEQQGVAQAVSVTIAGKDEGGRPVAYLASGRRRSFGRIRLRGTILRRCEGEQDREADSLARLLVETHGNHGADVERLASFIAELEQTVLKHAQSELERQRAVIAGSEDYDDLETLCGAGHPYHPCFKSRVGFDLEDNAAFGPELGAKVRPLWIAARGDLTVRAASGGLEVSHFLRHELGGPLWQAWRDRVADRGAAPDDFVLIPVHPWQWREQIVPLFYDDLHRGDLIPLGQSLDDYRPQQSIRTLANLSAPRKSSLKQSLSIVNTSTARILAPHTVANAPRISDWLASLAAADPFLSEELRTVFLREVLGAAYDPPQLPPMQPRSYGILSCIWRESLHAYLQPDETAMPWTALTHVDPAGRPYIQPRLRAHGLEWIERLLDVAITPVLHLLVAHGVALEAHAQNMILILRNGMPSRLALKDFHDGVRFSPAHLARGDQMPALHPTPARHVRVNRNSYLTVQDPVAVRDFLYDAFFFINLGELSTFLDERLAFPESRFWSRVEVAINAYRARWPTLANRAELFDLRPARIEVEKLTRRRLFAESEPQTHLIPSPFTNLTL